MNDELGSGNDDFALDELCGWSDCDSTGFVETRKSRAKNTGTKAKRAKKPSQHKVLTGVVKGDPATTQLAAGSPLRDRGPSPDQAIAQIDKKLGQGDSLLKSSFCLPLPESILNPVAPIRSPQQTKTASPQNKTSPTKVQRPPVPPSVQCHIVASLPEAQDWPSRPEPLPLLGRHHDEMIETSAKPNESAFRSKPAATSTTMMLRPMPQQHIEPLLRGRVLVSHKTKKLLSKNDKPTVRAHLTQRAASQRYADVTQRSGRALDAPRRRSLMDNDSDHSDDDSRYDSHNGATTSPLVQTLVSLASLSMHS